MRLESAAGLKQQLLQDVLEPIAAAARRLPVRPARAARLRTVTEGLLSGTVFGVGARPLDTLPVVQRSVALGIAPSGSEFRLAIRVQRQGLLHGPLVTQLVNRAHGEADVRLIGRVDKRTKGRRKTAGRSVRTLKASGAAGTAPRGRRAVARLASLSTDVPWFQQNTRPLLIGASVGHIDVTAGTIGAFVSRHGRVCILSNNHVLANEDRATLGDPIIQRGRLDGGTSSDQVAAFLAAIEVDPGGSNLVDAAVAEIGGLDHDPSLLREMVGGGDRELAGLGPAQVDEHSIVHKVGRTTGTTEGRVTAFDLDNVIVNFDVGNVRFDGQLEIEGVGDQMFSDGGDSGALIVNDAMEAVGLLFSGTESGGSNGLGLTYANPIHLVLDELEATLLF